ncbi:hypothetical protein E2C01_039532 [Portunus trituberculatus]|uniref:Uncharacterized protein n=1 Tax=Portunus trituberculatus TaxID=210409 RepID=A0A5B7FK24_PORTR|nr:hypothetical protein [Portunus trituberculatus]
MLAAMAQLSITIIESGKSIRLSIYAVVPSCRGLGGTLRGKVCEGDGGMLLNSWADDNTNGQQRKMNEY